MKIEINEKKNNHGIALASVLIVMALIGLLASSVLNLSYLAYQRKLVENKNTENFYAAEAVLDSVKALLQNAAAVAIDETEEDSTKFAAAAKSEIEKMYTSEGYDNLRDYLYYEIGFYTENMYDSSDTDTYILVAMADTDESVYVGGSTYINGNGGYFSVGEMVASEDGTELYIKDVKIKYVNNEGYTAEISTDIVIKAPTYASDDDVPLGTYSMFAGNGSSISSNGTVDYQKQNNKASFGNALYIHQDGNVYVGAQLENDGSESKTAFEVSGNDGSTFVSFGGTTIVFNGDVVIDDKNALFFTGGDGTETANIQVNGYIVLKEGSSLFLPSNCNLVCKGIVTELEYDDDGNITTISYYNGAGAQSTVSQFYPFTTAYVSSNSTYTSKFLYNEGDVASVLMDMGVDEVALTYVDQQYKNVMEGTIDVGGVYILDTAYNEDGWQRTGNEYYALLSCNVVGSVWTWTNNGASVTAITCDPTDTKLTQEPKVEYNGVSYDAEFAEIMNIHLFSTVNEKMNITTYLTGYAFDDDTTYNEVTWNEVVLTSERKYTNSDLQVKSKTNIYDSLWTYNYSSRFNWSQIYSLGYDTREFIIPSSTTTGTISYDDYTITTSDKIYSSESEYNLINKSSGTVEGVDGMIAVLITNNSLTVHTVGDYAGIFMSADIVEFGHCTGVVRGISLIQLADETTEHAGISDKDNDVRKYLTMLGTSLVAKDNQTGSVMYSYNDSETNEYIQEMLYEFALGDNMFNGGVARFWSTGGSSDDSSGSNSANNKDTSFVGTENWSKD